MTPALDEAWSRYRAGDLAAAEQCAWALLTAAGATETGAAWHLLSLVAHRRGQPAVAIERIRQALDHEPDNATYLVHASEIFRKAQQLPDAKVAAQAAVRLHPELPGAHNNLGLVLQDLGDLEAAEAAFRQAVQVTPGYARGWCNLGSLLLRRNHLAQAESALRQALQLQPDYPQALNSLGEVLRRAEQSGAALDCFQTALSLKPGYAPALLNLGNTLAGLRRLDEAEACLRRALQTDPEYAAAWHDLGALHEAAGRLPDAIDAYQRACDRQPDSYGALAGLENARRRICDWSGQADNVPRLLQAVRDCLARNEPSPLWPLASCRFPTTNADRLGIARQYARQLSVEQGPLHRTKLPLDGGRLRIGFLAHEFCNSVAGHLMQGLFERFDRSRFEVLAFDYSPDDGSAIRRRIRAGCDRFLELRVLTSAGIAQRIAAEGVHILLDINSYMTGGRPAIAAWRPAPVQVSYMYPATTGAGFIDYFLTDRVATPAGHDCWFTEKLVYLPCAYLPASADYAAPPAGPVSSPVPTSHLNTESTPDNPPARSASGVPPNGSALCSFHPPANGFVFCSFNAPDKIDPPTFDVWMRILNRVPGSVLWQRDDGPHVQANLRREARQRGVDPDRICFAPKVPDTATHLARHRCADLFLDTFNHGAHATAADALGAGLPLLTCPGQTFASRVAASLLTQAGLPELIAADAAAFEELAVRLANNPQELDALRQRLNEARRTGTLFDTDRLVRNLEAAFQEMWRSRE